MTSITCYSCKGTGFLPHYSHNAGGVCFTCGGAGKVADVGMDRDTRRDLIDGHIFSNEMDMFFTIDEAMANRVWAFQQLDKGKPMSEVLAALKGSLAKRQKAGIRAKH